MTEQFTVPEDYQESFRRLIPYIAAPLQGNEQFLESLLIYLKLGGEKLARIAIDAFNVAQRLYDAEMIKQLREQALLSDLNDDSDDDEADEADEDDEDDEDVEDDEDDEDDID